MTRENLRTDRESRRDRHTQAEGRRRSPQHARLIEHENAKICARDGELHPISDFGKNPRMASGLKSYCKDCNAELQKEWRAMKKGARSTRAAQKKSRRTHR